MLKKLNFPNINYIIINLRYIADIAFINYQLIIVNPFMVLFHVFFIHIKNSLRVVKESVNFGIIIIEITLKKLTFPNS